jgi:hypothetical protein
VHACATARRLISAMSLRVCVCVCLQRQLLCLQTVKHKSADLISAMSLRVCACRDSSFIAYKLCTTGVQSCLLPSTLLCRKRQEADISIVTPLLY